MITIEDIKRLHLPNLTSIQIRRINNAEKACADSIENYVRSMIVCTTSERLYINEYILC